MTKKIEKIDYVESVKVEGHGFINLFLKKNFWLSELKKVLSENDKYGESDLGKSKKVIIEFVSANPTGPLHIGHCRGAVYGDVLCNHQQLANLQDSKPPAVLWNFATLTATHQRHYQILQVLRVQGILLFKSWGILDMISTPIKCIKCEEIIDIDAEQQNSDGRALGRAAPI